MANFYTEHPELRFHLNNPLMERICELKERSYKDKDEYDYAPQDFADAIDSYDKVLEITGEITDEVIAANAEGVDEEGPHCANGRVEYASGTKQNLDAMVKAGLNGMTLPRRFGGLNFPITPYTMCVEIVAAADAGCILTDCADFAARNTYCTTSAAVAAPAAVATGTAAAPAAVTGRGTTLIVPFYVATIRTFYTLVSRCTCFAILPAAAANTGCVGAAVGLNHTGLDCYGTGIICGTAVSAPLSARAALSACTASDPVIVTPCSCTTGAISFFASTASATI